MKLAIIVHGGIVQNVLADEEIEVRIIDRDVEGADDEDIVTVDGEDAFIYGSLLEAEVNEEKITQLYSEIAEQETDL